MADRPTESGEQERRNRISLGSIPAGQLSQHFAAFGISSLIMLAVRVYNGVLVTGADPTWHQVIDLIGEKGGSTMAACLGLSSIGVEGGNMVLAELFRRNRRQKDFAEGAIEMHRRWSDWLSRKEAAEARGEPFTEPPPQPENGDRRDA